MLPTLVTTGFNPFAYLKPKRMPETKPQISSMVASVSEQMQAARDQLLLYSHIINRYADTIEAGEAKSITELRELVAPDDLAIQKLRNVIAGKIPGYDSNRDFLLAAQAAYEWVKSGIREVEVPVKFWLRPEEIVDLGVADSTDRAIFLCSLLVALGNPAARVMVVELEGGATRAITSFSFGSGRATGDPRTYLLDPRPDLEFDSLCGGRQWVLSSYSHKGKRIEKVLYEFNNTEYAEGAV